jgi:autotransporter-associated beta strand protein
MTSSTYNFHVYVVNPALQISDILSGAMAVVKSGPGNLYLTGVNTYSGGTTVIAGTIICSTSNVKGAILNSGSILFDQATDGTYADVISGTGSLSKSGSGTLTLSANNTYSGGTNANGGTINFAVSQQISGLMTISGGTIKLGHNNAIGTSSIKLFNGKISNSSSNPITISNGFSSSGTASATITFGDDATTPKITFTGSLNLNGGTKTFNTLNTTEFSGVISNASSSLTKNGTGTLILSGANTYGGATSITAGSLVSIKGTATATFTSTTLSVNFSSPPAAGTVTIRFFPGVTTQSYGSVSLIGAPSRTATYNSSNSTLTIT